MSSESSKNGSSFKNVLKIEAKSASIYTLATFITQFGSFLIVPFFWQKLSITDYGIIAVIEIIGSFLGMFLGLQLDISITRFYYEWDESERKRKAGNIWVFSWLSTLLLGVLSIYIFSIISTYLFKDVPFFPFIYLGLIGIVVARLSVVPFATLRIVNKPILYAVFSIVSFLIQMGLNIYYVLILDEKLTGLLVSNIIGSVITSILGFVIMLRFATPNMNWNELKAPLKFSLPQIPASTISGMTSLLDRFLLQRFASLEVMGVYSLCLKFTNLALHLHNSLKISFVPFMVKALNDNKEAGIVIITKMRLYYILPIMVFSLAIVLYINDFVFWINRPDYFPITQWVSWLIIPVLLSTFTVYFAPGLFLAKRSDLTWIPAMVQMLVVLIFGWLLIPEFKMAGVVMSRYASVVSLFLITYILSQKHYPIPVKWKKVSFLVSLLILIIIASKSLAQDTLMKSIILNTILLIVYSSVSFGIVIGVSGLSLVATTFDRILNSSKKPS